MNTKPVAQNKVVPDIMYKGRLQLAEAAEKVDTKQDNLQGGNLVFFIFKKQVYSQNKNKLVLPGLPAVLIEQARLYFQ